MLLFEDFRDYVVEHILEYLPEEYVDAHVKAYEVMTNNGQFPTALSIRKAGSSVAANLYINAFYDPLLADERLETVMREIASEFRECVDPETFKNIRDSLNDFEQIKDKIVMKAINAGRNEEYLSDKVYTKWEDLAILYQVLVREEECSRYAVSITTDMFKQYGISMSELYALARENSERLNPGFISPIREVLMQIKESMPEEDSTPDISNLAESAEMYVMTNEKRVNGAAVLFYNMDLLKGLSEKMNGDLIVLPSSIHELIVIPAEGVNYEYLLATVKYVNETNVAPGEMLAENVYLYNKEHNMVKALFGEEEARTAGIKNHR